MSGVPRLGLLGLMLELYDRALPELKPDQERFARELVGSLQGVGEVTWGGIAVTRAEVEERMAQFRAADVDLVVVVHLSYAPSLIALPALVRSDIPVVLFSTQELAGIDDSFGYEAMLKNHGVHGAQDLANVLRRAGKAFGAVTGHYQDRRSLAEVAEWAVAASTVRKLRRAEIGRVGWAFQDMGDFGLDETAFLTQVGPHVQQIPLDLLADGVAAAPASEIADLVADYRASYEVAPDLSDADLEASARAEWAMRRAVGQLGLSGISLHYEVMGQDPRFGALPFAAAARLLAEGVSFGGEGDVVSSAAVLMMHHLCGMSTFSEMFTLDFAGDTIFMSHFAEGNPLMARQGEPIQMVRRDGWVGSGGVSASLAFTIEPGPVTMVNLTVARGGAFQIIATRGRAESFLIPGQPTPHFRLRPERPVAEFCNDYLLHGGSHHVAVSPGHHLGRVRKCAKLMGVDCIEL